jgi:hypothetical protein
LNRQKDSRFQWNDRRHKELYIGDVVHRAVIDESEEGTEAAAATGVGFRIVSVPINFEVTRPFLFYIVDDATGAILFQGRIVDPAATTRRKTMHTKPLGSIALTLMLAAMAIASTQGTASARAGSTPVPGIYPWSDQVRSDPFQRSDSNDRLFPWARSGGRVCGYERIRAGSRTTPRYRCQ